MFIAKKYDNYFVVEDTTGSIFYSFKSNESEVTKFKNKESLESALKKSGFLAHSGVVILEVE